MTKKIAVITGINGQDGSYLAELLLSKNYQIFGAINKNSQNTENIKNILSQIELFDYDLQENQNLSKNLQAIKPHEIYHLAGSSFVDNNQNQLEKLIILNSDSTKNILENIKNFLPNCRFFLAGSSEMFGESNQSPQNENSQFNPQNPYGISKLLAYENLKLYRQKHKIFASCGILYNHESPRRNPVFLTRKISMAVAKIYLGLENKIILGDISSSRDFSHAKDVVQGIYLMMQQEIPDDYIVSSGTSTSIEEVLQIAFNYKNLDYKKYLQIDQNLIRKSTKLTLLGDNSKIKKQLNYQPQYKINEIIIEMIENDIVKIKTTNKINKIYN
jgi:GDPmannose 4,6-dehydratase